MFLSIVCKIIKISCVFDRANLALSARNKGEGISAQIKLFFLSASLAARKTHFEPILRTCYCSTYDITPHSYFHNAMFLKSYKILEFEIFFMYREET